MKSNLARKFGRKHGIGCTKALGEEAGADAEALGNGIDCGQDISAAPMDPKGLPRTNADGESDADQLLTCDQRRGGGLKVQQPRGTMQGVL
jgi:hypothetical protein